MGFSNGLLSSKTEKKGEKGEKGDKGEGFTMTADEHFHLQNKRLKGHCHTIWQLY